MNFDFKLKGTEKVTDFYSSTSKKPMVSVCVQTYNQEKYIHKCLDGILNQKTNFEYEILLGEDESNDGTRDICISYAKKFPDKIRLFLHDRSNVINFDGCASGKYNSLYNLHQSRGEYIAICEGDDYWTDTLKLQKQIDFLELNYDYGMVYSDVYLMDEKGNRIKSNEAYEKSKERFESGYLYWNLLHKNFIQTLTVCVQKKLFVQYFNKFPNEEFAFDLRYWLFISCRTKIKFMDEKMASYRIHNLGLSRSNRFFAKRRPLVKQSAIIDYFELEKTFEKTNKTVLSDVLYDLVFVNDLDKLEKVPIMTFLKKRPKYFFLILFSFLRRLTNLLLIVNKNKDKKKLV